MSISATMLPHVAGLFPNGHQATSPSYVYIGAILESLGREDQVSDLWGWLSTQYPSHAEQLLVARRLREGLLMASALVGFPRGINALAALRASVSRTSPTVQEMLDQDTSLRQSVSESAREHRGKAFFEKVYAHHAARILENMARSSGGYLAEFAVDCIYGGLLAETSILSEKETGLLEFACCFAMGATPQAKGHMYGSRNLGNGREEVEAVMGMCVEIASQLGMVMDRHGQEDWAFLKRLESW